MPSLSSAMPFSAFSKTALNFASLRRIASSAWRARRKRVDRRDQDRRFDRMGQIAIGASVEPADLVVVVDEGGRQINDRCARGPRRPPATRRQTSKPSISGRLTSRTIRSGPLSLRAMASWPGPGFDDGEPGGAEDAAGGVARRPDCRRRPGSTPSDSSGIAGPPSAAAGRVARSRSCPGSSTGSSTEKTSSPTPTGLRTLTSPPSMIASFLLSDRPRPVPRRRFWIGASTCTKSWKSTSRCSGRDADAGVGDRERHASVAGQRRRDPHFALDRELERVRDEVAENLRQPSCRR